MIAGRKILVAGGSGLVGANLTRRLMREGADVTASYFTRPPAEDLAKVCRRFDFTAFEDCLKATAGAELAVLSAAHVSGAKGMRDNPTAFLLPNLQIQAGLLEACSRNRVKKVVLLSSSTVYQPADHPVAEAELDLNQPPFDLYFGVGWLNRYLEKLAAFYQKTGRLQVQILRPTNLYGPHDHFDPDHAHVLPALIRRAVEKENPFVVWGDGGVVRNFLFIEDFVADLLLVLGKDGPGEPLNVASDVNTTIREAVTVVLNAAGHRVEPRFDLSKPTAIPYRALETERFSAAFGRRPRTTLAEGVKRTIEWYSAHR